MSLVQRRSGRVAGWLLAYLLSLHAILGSFLAVPPAAAGDAVLGGIICVTSGASHDGDAGAPQHKIDHCAACVVMGAAAPPPEIAAVTVAYDPRPVLRPASRSAWQARAPCDRPGGPRAPPSLA